MPKGVSSAKANAMAKRIKAKTRAFTAKTGYKAPKIRGFK